jgi:hypothetical protein
MAVCKLFRNLNTIIQTTGNSTLTDKLFKRLRKSKKNIIKIISALIWPIRMKKTSKISNQIRGQGGTGSPIPINQTTSHQLTPSLIVAFRTTSHILTLFTTQHLFQTSICALLNRLVTTNRLNGWSVINFFYHGHPSLRNLWRSLDDL